MVDRTDWRLSGQDRYLKGVELRRQKYRHFPDNPKWDHDHCKFCWAKFSLDDGPDIQHEGYCTLDEYHWICPTCFGDFQGSFEWRVVE